MEERVSFERALELLTEGVLPCGTERIPALRAWGRVLAESVKAPMDQPPWPRAAMDGYAVRAAETAGASADRPVRFLVKDRICAGGTPSVKIGKGEAARIMTGAPVPPECDCVVRQEDTVRGEAGELQEDTVRGEAGERQEETARGASGERQEETVRENSGTGDVLVLKEMKPWENYCFAGDDFRKGAVILPAGTRIDGNAVGILASAGLWKEGTELTVYRKVRCALICTGDELVPAAWPEGGAAKRGTAGCSTADGGMNAGGAAENGSRAADWGPAEGSMNVGGAADWDPADGDVLRLPPGKIYSSNGPALLCRLRDLGAEVIMYRETFPDSAEALAEAFREAAGPGSRGRTGAGACGQHSGAGQEEAQKEAQKADLIITVGGVSVGEKDILHETLAHPDAEILFRGVRLKPGAPMIYSKYRGVPVLSLSGNPFAAAATFELFARPFIARLSGNESLWPQRLRGVLRTPFGKTGKVPRFVRALFRDGEVFLPEGHSSGLLSSAAGTNCLAVIPAGGGPLPAGSEVEVRLL